MVKRYQVEVFISGIFITQHIVEADDALSAIDQVETEYGAPPKVEFATVQLESGKKEHLLVVSDWHGYSFNARLIKT